MTTRHAVILLATILTTLVAAAPAAANYRVGMGDQSPAMFANPAFQALELKRTRYIVPWDWYRTEAGRAELQTFMTAARQSRFEVLVTFSAKRGCFVGSRYSKRRACRAPSVKTFKSQFRKFRAAYPWARLYATWNEANHVSQPIARSPRTAARYYNALRSACKRCKILATTVLDSSNAQSYLRGFLRHAKGRPRLWGIHNYQDVNRRRTSGTARILKTVPGEVWMTETGGIVSFGRSFRYSESRAASRTKTMFKLADRFDDRRRGHRSRITRLYYYQWTGAPRGTRFDAGLTNPDGSVRKAYSVFKRYAKRRWK